MQLYMLSTVLGLVAAVNASLGHSVIPRIKATDLVNRLAPLKWTGVVVPDQGSVTLTGSSNEVSSFPVDLTGTIAYICA